MTPQTSYFLAACFLFIVYLICKAMHDRGRSLPRRHIIHTDQRERVEVANGRQRGVGWVQPGGPGVIGNHLLIQALRDAGWKGEIFVK